MDNSVSKIPDIWYDFYVRFLVGCYALLCMGFIHYYINKATFITFEWEILLALLGISFLIGHILQPINSAVARIIQNSSKSYEVRRLVSMSSSTSQRQKILVSKRVAELVSMVGFMNVTIITLTFILVKDGLSSKLIGNEIYYLWILLLYFIYSTVERNLSLYNSQRYLPDSEQLEKYKLKHSPGKDE